MDRGTKSLTSLYALLAFKDCERWVMLRGYKLACQLLKGRVDDGSVSSSHSMHASFEKNVKDYYVQEIYSIPGHLILLLTSLLENGKRKSSVIVFDIMPQNERNINAASLWKGLSQNCEDGYPGLLSTGMIAASFSTPVVCILFAEQYSSRLSTKKFHHGTIVTHSTSSTHTSSSRNLGLGQPCILAVLQDGSVFSFMWQLRRRRWIAMPIIQLLTPDTIQDTRTIMDACVISVLINGKICVYLYWWESRSSVTQDSIWRGELQFEKRDQFSLHHVSRVYPQPKEGVMGDRIVGLLPAQHGVWLQTATGICHLQAENNVLWLGQIPSLVNKAEEKSSVSLQDAGKTPEILPFKEGADESLLKDLTMTEEIGLDWSDDEFGEDLKVETTLEKEKLIDFDPSNRDGKIEDAKDLNSTLEISSSSLKEKKYHIILCPQTGELVVLCKGTWVYVISAPKHSTRSGFQNFQVTKLCQLEEFGPEGTQTIQFPFEEIENLFVHRRTLGILHKKNSKSLSCSLFDVITGIQLHVLPLPSFSHQNTQVRFWERPHPLSSMGLYLQEKVSTHASPGCSSGATAFCFRYPSIQARVKSLLKNSSQIPEHRLRTLEAAMRVCQDWSLHDWRARYALELAMEKKDSAACRELLTQCQNPALAVSLLAHEPAHRRWLLQKVRAWLDEYHAHTGMESNPPWSTEKKGAVETKDVANGPVSSFLDAQAESARLRSRRAFELSTPLNAQICADLERFARLLEDVHELGSTVSSTWKEEKEKEDSSMITWDDPFHSAFMRSAVARRPWEGSPATLEALAQINPQFTLRQLCHHFFDPLLTEANLDQDPHLRFIAQSLSNLYATLYASSHEDREKTQELCVSEAAVPREEEEKISLDLGLSKQGLAQDMDLLRVVPERALISQYAACAEKLLEKSHVLECLVRLIYDQTPSFLIPLLHILSCQEMGQMEEKEHIPEEKDLGREKKKVASGWVSYAKMMISALPVCTFIFSKAPSAQGVQIRVQSVLLWAAEEYALAVRYLLSWVAIVEEGTSSALVPENGLQTRQDEVYWSCAMYLFQRIHGLVEAERKGKDVGGGVSTGDRVSLVDDRQIDEVEIFDCCLFTACRSFEQKRRKERVQEVLALSPCQLTGIGFIQSLYGHLLPTGSSQSATYSMPSRESPPITARRGEICIGDIRNHLEKHLPITQIPISIDLSTLSRVVEEDELE